jgi:uncharacterized caspase-like protein
MRDWFWALRNLLWVVFVTCSALDTQAAGSRIALVIGNSAYKHAPPLSNPIHDATDVAGALEQLGFEVVRGIDLDYASMREHMLRFTNKLANAEVVFFYYAGHALHVTGRNYLIPVDAKIESEYDLDLLAVDLDLVLRGMTRATRTTLVFLDACRDNPFVARLARRVGGRSIAVNRGLAPVASGIGSLIVFATEPGSVALDGEGRNSPFTAALLQNIQRPGIQITDMMVAVRKEVLRLTDGQQVPWEHSSLVGKFFFVPQSMSAPESGAEDATGQRQIDSRNLEIAFWNSIKNRKAPACSKLTSTDIQTGSLPTLLRSTSRSSGPQSTSFQSTNPMTKR